VPDTPPQRIGKYEVTDLLGQGAMGVVYRALDPALGRYVAIKVMSQGIAADQELRDRFLREARAAGSLQHPNIITIYDFGEADGFLYIAMEYVEGSDLSEVMERKDPLPITGKIDIIVDVLHALDYAHSRGVVHRDVKPANIRVSVDGRAKLMDFGIARLEKSDLTRSGVMIGTPDYMAPEQITSAEITPATDVFAMGVVLYEFLTGKRTFEGDTLHAVLYNVLHVQPPPLHEASAAVPASLQPVLDVALAKDPKDRYPTAGGMAHALMAVRTALSGGATVSIAARATPLRTQRISEPLRWSKQVRRKRAVRWIAGGAVVLALGAVAVVVMLSRGSRQGANVAAGGAARPDAGQAPGFAALAAGARAESSNAVTVPPADAPARSSAAAPGGAAPSGAARPGPGPRPSVSQAAPGSRPTSGVQQPAAAAPAVQAPGQAPQSQAAAPVQADVPAAPAPGAVPAAPTTSPAAAPAAVAPAPTPAVPEPAADPRPDIENLIAAYARALEQRSIAEVRRVYPSITSDQQRDWEQFFRAARSVKARLAVTRLDVGAGSADLTVSGGLEFDTGGGPQSQAMSFRATAALENGAWRLRSVR
jgi:serine/threonine-protein kinase